MVGGGAGLVFSHPGMGGASLASPALTDETFTACLLLPTLSSPSSQQAEQGLWASKKVTSPPHPSPEQAKELKNAAGSVGWVTLGTQPRVVHNMAQSGSFNSESRDTEPGVGMCYHYIPSCTAAELQAGAFLDTESALAMNQVRESQLLALIPN